MRYHAALPSPGTKAAAHPPRFPGDHQFLLCVDGWIAHFP